MYIESVQEISCTPLNAKDWGAGISGVWWHWDGFLFRSFSGRRGLVINGAWGCTPPEADFDSVKAILQEAIAR